MQLIVTLSDTNGSITIYKLTGEDQIFVTEPPAVDVYAGTNLPDALDVVEQNLFQR